MAKQDRREVNRWLVGAAAVMLCVYLTTFLLEWLRPTLAEDAVRAARAEFVDRDPRKLYDFTLEFQREQIRLSREQYAQMWRALMEPRLADFEVVRIGAPSMTHTQGTVEWELRHRDGHSFSYGTVVWNTDNGGQFDAFEPLLLAWWLEYGVKRGKKMGTISFAEALLEGLRNDRYELEQLGIRYRPSQYPGQMALSLEQWEQNVRNRLQAAIQARDQERLD
ncbi:MAG: hypothetical protein KatS3mg015_1517 [Fimbriimonadales bacterium]|nr:MAG: hypothetical protein KatS3mg015_1517 [Fimbriimonadales bacterium]